jgi:hypothetical protein
VIAYVDNIVFHGEVGPIGTGCGVLIRGLATGGGEKRA